MSGGAAAVRHDPPRRTVTGALLFAVSVAGHFVATTMFVWTIGFLADAERLPYTVNHGGPASPPVVAAAVNLALLALFALPHSAMARQWYKRATARVVPAALERTAYNLVSSALLAVVYLQWRPITAVVWDAGRYRPVVLALFWAAWMLGAAAVVGMNLFDLTGVRQGWARLHGRVCEPVEFRTPHVYRALRHPLYVAFIAGAFAAPVMTMGQLLFALGTLGYIVAAIPFEERDLITTFGERYVRYRERVGGLLPRLR